MLIQRAWQFLLASIFFSPSQHLLATLWSWLLFIKWRPFIHQQNCYFDAWQSPIYFSERIFYSNQSFAAPTYWLDLRYNDQINAMLTLYRITLAPARKPYRIGLLFTHNNGDLGEISVTDGTLFFFKREAGKFSQANIVFICGSCWKQIFLCLRLPANTLFFTCIQFISVFTLSANDLSQNFPEESHIAY